MYDRDCHAPMPNSMKAVACLVFILPSLVVAQTQPTLGTRGVPIIEQTGLRFRDLNRNGILDPYEDWRLTPAASFASQNNALQAIAERTRLGIPLTISTDPRNHFQALAGATVAAGQFSQWPEALGFAALNDTALTRRFADIARREYRAVGIT